MAKYRRRRFYRRKTGKWSSNIERINLSGTTTAGVRFGDSYVIAQNPGQNNSSVSQQYTVKNIEVSAQLEAPTPSNDIEEICYYIMYVPEGYPVGLQLPFTHPEWIMAYKFIGQGASATQASNYQTPKIKTRLSRRLNTGDSIIFLYTGNNVSNQNVDIKFSGLVRWWTKAN